MFSSVLRGPLVALALWPAWAAALTFDGALAAARREAPALAALQSRVDAARHAVRPAGERPDPKLAFGVENLPISGDAAFRLTREPMTMQRLALIQDLPSRDKRDARSAMARARVDRAQADVAVAALTVQRETALAWIRRRTIERQLERLDGLYEENRLFDAAVRARLASRPSMAGGGAMAADAVMPKLEAAMLDERRDELSMQRAQAIAALARWVGEAAREPLEGDVPQWPLQADALHERLHGHPELRAVGAMAGELDAELREAQAMKKPDWGIEVAYQRRGREFGDMVSVMLMVELPVFAADRQDPRIAAKAAERAAVDAERAAMAREHLQMLEADLAELERLDRALARQRDTVLPLARERIELATAAYGGGQGALMDVVSARRERVEAELKTIALEGERLGTAARLHFAAGEGETR